MHEFGLARDIIRRAVREAEDSQGTRVEALHIALGKEQFVDQEALTLGIMAAARGTLAEGVQVQITRCSGGGVVLKSVQIGED